MATRKEERERLRKLREETERREASGQRRRLMIGYVFAALLGLAVIIGIVVLIGSSGGGSSGGGKAHVDLATGMTNEVPTDERTGPTPPAIKVGGLKAAAKAAGCVLKLNLTDEGHQHVPRGTDVKYKTVPPTSGSHVEPPYQQADGAYSEQPPAIDVVHSMEHGRMEIQYSSKLPESEQLELKGLYDTLYGGTLMFPNDDMPYQVAVTTWTNLMGCKTYEGQSTLDAIRDFGRETWGKYGAPAEIGGFPVGGPNPADQ